VIQDVDDTVKVLLMRKMPIDMQNVYIAFEMPTPEWIAGVSKPTLNVFLYDVRENHELRSSERTITRVGEIATERRAPTRIDLSYLITAWTAVVADEHKLLGNALATLLRFPTLPADVLQGALATQPPVPTWVAQPERTPNSWDFWSSLDGRLKAGISYVVTVAVELYPPVTHHVVTEKILNVRELA
jgi:hypothetical protein